MNTGLRDTRTTCFREHGITKGDWKLGSTTRVSSLIYMLRPILWILQREAAYGWAYAADSAWVTSTRILCYCRLCDWGLCEAVWQEILLYTRKGKEYYQLCLWHELFPFPIQLELNGIELYTEVMQLHLNLLNCGVFLLQVALKGGKFLGSHIKHWL